MVGEVGVVEGMKGWGRGQESEQMADIAHTAPLPSCPTCTPPPTPVAAQRVMEWWTGERGGGGN